MAISTSIESILSPIGCMHRLDKYLGQCRVVTESEGATGVPPTMAETMDLISFLRKHGSSPLIVGSVGVLHHLKSVDPSFGFRPTADLDVWVRKMPPCLPPNWSVDLESIGVPSWKSPTGGQVDFLLPNSDMPSGSRVPSKLEPDPSTINSPLPMASLNSLLRLKLDSTREKDFADSVALVRACGRMPEAHEFGRLNRNQVENYEMVKRWFEIRPHANYGE